MKRNDLSLLLVAALSLFIFLSRWLPHQPNLTPVIALCLFAGFLARGQVYGFLLPLSALVASDWLIGFYPGWGFTYVSLVGVLLAGAFLRPQLSSFIGFGLGGAILFFLGSNYGVWMSSQMYPPTFGGLLNCYQMGIPFFRSTVTGTLFFMTLFYFGYHFVSSKLNLSDASQKV